MKKEFSKTRQINKDDEMRREYDFTGGVRGKHYRAMQAGYTITIHRADGTTLVKEVKPVKGAIVLEPDVQKYFPDSDSVNATLRSLIRLVPRKRKSITKNLEDYHKIYVQLFSQIAIRQLTDDDQVAIK